MFNKILNLSTPQNSNSNASTSKLFDGINLVGKILITTKQWNSQFSKIQNQHSKYNHKQNNETSYQNLKQTLNLSNLDHKKQCSLCNKQKGADDFVLMSKCDHLFCFSCLNIYAISKIKDEQRVKCPEISCKQQMKLSSSVYKLLPQPIKLKYLQIKHKSKTKQIQIQNTCLRCMQQAHTGICKVKFSKQNIQSAFNYRKCNQCNQQISFNEGNKKINCNNCNFTFCIVCSETWPLEGAHKCPNQKKIFNLQKQIIDNAIQQKGRLQHYQSSHNKCVSNCAKCLNSCFYFKICNAQICLGNVFLFPVRLISTILVLAIYGIMLIPTIIIILGWFFASFLLGISIITCQIINQLNGGLQIIAFIFFPIVMLIGIFQALRKNFNSFSQAMKTLTQFYSKALCQMWISCGPQQCCM